MNAYEAPANEIEGEINLLHGSGPAQLHEQLAPVAPGPQARACLRRRAHRPSLRTPPAIRKVLFDQLGLSRAGCEPRSRLGLSCRQTAAVLSAFEKVALERRRSGRSCTADGSISTMPLARLQQARKSGWAPRGSGLRALSTAACLKRDNAWSRIQIADLLFTHAVRRRRRALKREWVLREDPARPATDDRYAAAASAAVARTLRSGRRPRRAGHALTPSTWTIRDAGAADGGRCPDICGPAPLSPVAIRARRRRSTPFRAFAVRRG